MKSVELKLFSLNNTSVIGFKSDMDVDDVVSSFLSIFDMDIDYENKEMNINPLQKKSIELAKRAYEFVENNKDQAPALHKFKQFVDGLNEEEYFYIFPNKELETSQVVELSQNLEALNKNLNIDEIKSSADAIFKFLLENYNLIAYDGHKPIKVGEPDKAKRICRFCQRKSPEVAFKKKAHAISEALGNKAIIANEECDSCNEKFGQGIENDLISYLSIFRPSFKIKGKESGYPKLKGNNFSFQRTSDDLLNIGIKGEDNFDLAAPVSLKTYEFITPQNIYRALCKYVVSIINASELPSLNKTIEWINGDFTASQLPKGRFFFHITFFQFSHA